MTVYFISDLHFSDPRILRYSRKDKFSNIREMNDYMINKWNFIVKNKDKIFIVGDFCSSRDENDFSFIKKLNGKKTLIPGNHDAMSNEFYINAGISNVCNYPIIYNDFCIVSHYPTFVNINMPYINIYGHIHDNLNYKKVSACGYCVCAEVNDYIPVDFDTITKAVSDERKLIDKNYF